MFSRQLKVPKGTFLLLGPRGTGKSTWLKTQFADAQYFDLLRNEVQLPLLRQPERLRELILARLKSPHEWIVIDEVQRVPALLNEVHSLIEDHRLKFALSGSSARKLKRDQSNLLGGRAIVRHLFPLTYGELANKWNLKSALLYGQLPVAIAEPDLTIGRLEAYVGTYLREEIKEEAMTRKVDAFSRFLEIASLANAQVTNLSNIARDAQVPRPTVTTYFEILRDTLIGDFVPAWAPRAKVKEIAHPKFYFFDCGVLRAIQGRLRDEPSAEEKGLLLETYILHELRAYIHYADLGGQIFYWRTADRAEVDFIWKRGNRVIAIEVKSANNWRPDFDRGFRSLLDSKAKVHAAWGVYLGREPLKKSFGQVLPVENFLKHLAMGKILF